MPCYSPLKGWKARGGGICFNRRESPTGALFQVPCGQCYGCRREKSRQWAVRIMHEASLHERNSFLTLTYDAEHLPAGGSLDKSAFPRFMKRLRKKYPKRKFRYYHCGEYGEKRKRPHYHACLFGEDFSSSRAPFWRKGQKFPEWISPDLMELWPEGQSLIGSLSFESASYVARYVVDKVTGSRAELHYEEVDPGTGEITSRVPEFATMSRRPGIAGDWFDRFAGDVFPADEVVVAGVRTAPPRYFSDRLAELPEEVRASVATKRLNRVFRKLYDRTEARLHVREVCAKARVNLYQRELDL